MWKFTSFQYLFLCEKSKCNKCLNCTLYPKMSEIDILMLHVKEHRRILIIPLMVLFS